VKSITNSLDQTKYRISGIEDKLKEVLHSDSNKEKKNKARHWWLTPEILSTKEAEIRYGGSKPVPGK
jgi:hypothetical protein